eukprot:3280504-Pyramimonas_sp.AAC.1
MVARSFRGYTQSIYNDPVAKSAAPFHEAPRRGRVSLDPLCFNYINDQVLGGGIQKALSWANTKLLNVSPICFKRAPNIAFA